MKNFILLTFCSCLVLFTAGQHTIIHDPNVMPRPVQPFHAIEVSNGINLLLSQGPEEALAVSASSTNVRDDIQTEVENGVLKISHSSDGKIWTSGDKRMKAYVSFIHLDQLKASNGSDVVITGEVTSDPLLAFS